MTFEGNGGEMAVPERHRIPHYHGNETRVIFFTSAVVLIVAQSTGADLPLSTFEAVLTAIVLVIVAGITNPAQGWIHWLNEALAIGGILLFGTAAIDRYRAGTSILEPSFLYIEAIALLSLVALYFTTRTIRGFHLRGTV